MATENGLRKLQFVIEGVDSLIMHNGVALKDPLSKASKELKSVSGKKQKTDDDHEEMARIEFFASLYLNTKNQIIIPGYVLKAMIVNAAKRSKQGPTAKSALGIYEDNLLDYDGPKDIKKLYAEGMNMSRVAVKIGQSSVMRTRPEFKRWGLTFTVTFMPDLVDEASIKKFVEVAGREIGLCDWRPEHGRFTVESVKAVK